MYLVYILYSDKIDKYYVGFTQDLAKRFVRHLQSGKGFTSRAKDWKVVYQEFYDTKIEAYSREREIKQWKSRKKIEELIHNQ